MTQAVVLFSGGQDSTTCLCSAIVSFGAPHVLALSVDYGQRHRAELEAAAEIAELLMVRHLVLDLGVLGQLGGSALLRPDEPIAAVGGLEDAEAPAGLPTSFVPGRNLMLLSLAAAVAVQHGAKHVYTGVCQTDYSGYPDCRESFVRAMERAANEAMPTSCGPLCIHAPLMHLTKADTVRMAERFGALGWAALRLTITCYNGKRPGCGTCPACILRARGFAEAGEKDPAYDVA